MRPKRRSIFDAGQGAGARNSSAILSGERHSPARKGSPQRRGKVWNWYQGTDAEDGMKGEEENPAQSLEDANTIDAKLKDKSHS